MVAALPRGELMVVPEGTHTAPLEVPDLINECVDGFLRALPGW